MIKQICLRQNNGQKWLDNAFIMGLLTSKWSKRNYSTPFINEVIPEIKTVSLLYNFIDIFLLSSMKGMVQMNQDPIVKSINQEQGTKDPVEH